VPQYTLRWANRSNANQDWQISNGDHFTLQPNYVRAVQLDIHNTYTYQVAVSTQGGFTACALTWTSGTGQWTLQSVTPNEWDLAQGNGIVTLRCLLQNVTNLAAAPAYVAGDPTRGDGS